MTKENIYYIEHSYTCELAHNLTVIECKHQGITVDSRTRESGYTKLAETIFNNYVRMIEDIMLQNKL